MSKGPHPKEDDAVLKCGLDSLVFTLLRLPLTFRQRGCKMKPMRAKSATTLLIACFLVMSGICLCPGSIPEVSASNSHDCGSGPAAPTDGADGLCESGCAAEDAARARTEAEAQVADGFSHTINPAASEALTESAGQSARLQLSLSSEPPLPSNPPYIVHSVLLV